MWKRGMECAARSMRAKGGELSSGYGGVVQTSQQGTDRRSGDVRFRQSTAKWHFAGY